MSEAENAFSTNCPVAPLAIEAMRLLGLRDLYEARSPELFDVVLDRLSAVELGAVKLRPRSRLGMLFVLLLANGNLDPMVLMKDGEAEEGRRLDTARAAIEVVALAMAAPGDEPLLDYYATSAGRMISRAA